MPKRETTVPSARSPEWIRQMLCDHWPTYELRITTPRVQMRLPNDVELAGLAALAGAGVHAPSQRPFLTPWTDGTPEDRARFVLRERWGQLSGWAVDNWKLGLGVFTNDGEPVGMVTLRARDFLVVREVTTSSWLGLPHHGHGYGTEARLGLLTLAFDHLAAEAAVSEVFQDNHASQGRLAQAGVRTRRHLSQRKRIRGADL